MVVENTSVTDPDLSWSYAYGRWDRVPDPLDSYVGEDCDYLRALKVAGYEDWMELGVEGGALHLAVYQHKDRTQDSTLPRYLVWIDTLTDLKQISVGDLANLMELLAKLTPTITSALLTDMWDLTHDEINMLLRPTRQALDEEHYLNRERERRAKEARNKQEDKPK